MSTSINLRRIERRRVAIWGYGREGQAALLALRRLFPHKPLGLFVSEAEAEAWDFSVDPLLQVHVGAPTAGALSQYQYVIKSPGISPYDPRIEWAEFRGTRFISGSAIWFAEHARDHTLVVTGTKGKSTTASLIAHLLRAAGVRTALVGNIGAPLIEFLEPEPPPEWWVIELSSYQTRDFGGVPAVAVVLNLSPEHLDWHGDVERYYSDKLKVLAGGKADMAVLNAADPELMRRTAALQHRLLFNDPGGWHARGTIIHRGDEPILDLGTTRLSGAHNASNVCAALAAIEASGHDARSLARHVQSFRPLPHRLQRLGTRGGIEYINDSIATTPAATLAALASLSGRPVTLLVGGYDRGVPWDEFAARVQEQPPQAIVTIGAHGERIAALLAGPTGAAPVRVERAVDLADALERARALTPAGGTILLSPGAPSFNEFRDYAERGRRFAELAGFDPAAIGDIEGLGL